MKLALLQRKKHALEEFREMLLEKAKRKAALYKKKIAEESKKGSPAEG